jgi:hypothetical protein
MSCSLFPCFCIGSSVADVWLASISALPAETSECLLVKRFIQFRIVGQGWKDGQRGLEAT